MFMSSTPGERAALSFALSNTCYCDPAPQCACHCMPCLATVVFPLLHLVPAHQRPHCASRPVCCDRALVAHSHCRQGIQGGDFPCPGSLVPNACALASWTDALFLCFVNQPACKALVIYSNDASCAAACFATRLEAAAASPLVPNGRNVYSGALPPRHHLQAQMGAVPALWRCSKPCCQTSKTPSCTQPSLRCSASTCPAPSPTSFMTTRFRSVEGRQLLSSESSPWLPCMPPCCPSPCPAVTNGCCCYPVADPAAHAGTDCGQQRQLGCQRHRGAWLCGGRERPHVWNSGEGQPGLRVSGLPAGHAAQLGLACPSVMHEMEPATCVLPTGGHP